MQKQTPLYRKSREEYRRTLMANVKSQIDL